ncbi:MAG: endo alpha-1,4 polygalactosaminidase [Christensenellales bacterium]
MKRSILRQVAMMVLMLAFAMAVCASGAVAEAPAREPYGVFLSIDDTAMERLEPYQTVVIDAQYFSADDIRALHEKGHTVYTYLNVGSLEDFRDYYDDWKGICLGEYENWEEERWVDVSDVKWQEFMRVTLAKEFLDKGVDGFFVDNCDVYYEYPREEIFEGLVAILNGLMGYEKAVIINGGDTFADAYYDRYGTIDDVFTGINQETVITSIDFDEETFGKQNAEDSAYFKDYVERYAALGADIYLLEYATDADLIAKVQSYCAEHGFTYYVSESIELE